jgi:hypothetical protein
MTNTVTANSEADRTSERERAPATAWNSHLRTSRSDESTATIAAANGPQRGEHSNAVGDDQQDARCGRQPSVVFEELAHRKDTTEHDHEHTPDGEQ